MIPTPGGGGGEPLTIGALEHRESGLVVHCTVQAVAQRSGLVVKLELHPFTVDEEGRSLQEE